MTFMTRRWLLAAALCLSAGAAGAQPAASLPDFTGIVEKNAAAVVHVEAKYTGKGKSQRAKPRAGQQMPDDQQELLRRFFGMPMMPSPEAQESTSLGSGFIISADGYVITNNHVVEDADTVTVRLQDRRTLDAKVVGTDPKYDIALLKVSAGSLPAVAIGDSRALKAGQWVLAIGSPFGFDYTVTQGIVSAVGRNLGSRDQPYTSFIQTDVPINRGNSGGPLFDLAGKVVGVNSQIYSSTGGYQGVAFSIPIDVAMDAVQQIKQKGYVTRGMLGVQVGVVTDDMVKAWKLDSGVGAAVANVTPGSGAAKAGLRYGDIILSFNGQAIGQASDLPPLVASTRPGTVAKVGILREGKKLTVEATVGELPRDGNAVVNDGAGAGKMPGVTSSGKALGLEVTDLSASERKDASLGAGEGVAIKAVTGKAAQAAGLQAGDVVLMVNQTRVGTAAAFSEATRALKSGDTALLLVRRDDATQFIPITVP
jgi:serine protease Do